MSAVAENIPTEMPSPILFTDSAAAKVADLIAEEGNPDLKLRVFVQGGGCSGFQYGFTFDEITNEDDTTMTKNGVSLPLAATLPRAGWREWPVSGQDLSHHDVSSQRRAGQQSL